MNSICIAFGILGLLMMFISTLRVYRMRKALALMTEIVASATSQVRFMQQRIDDDARS